MSPGLDARTIRRALAGPRPRPPHGAWALVAYVASGVLLGGAHVHPDFAAAAWLSAICVALALLWSRRAVAVFGGLCLQQLAAILIGFDWIAAMNAVVFDFTSAESLGFFALAMVAGSVPFAAVVTAGFVGLHRRLALLWWLPTAYALGEALRFEVTVVALCDWMLSQWQVEPMLRAVGHLGWWGAHAVGLGAACALATALAARRLRSAWPAVAALGFFALPPLSTDGLELLEGVAVVHTDSTVDLPHRLPPGAPIELLVWPESAFDLQPRLVEGRTRGARMRPLLHGVDVTHLVGLQTTWPRRRPQNQAVVVDAEGQVRGARAKSRLMPVAEGRVLGLAEDRYVRGDAPPILQAAGRSVIPLICGEFMSRLLVADGVAAGGELLVALARDQMMLTERARRQLLAAQVMRSVEFGVPSVRASYGGEANIVGPDGRVLARGTLARNGILGWDRRHGARDTDFHGRPIGPATPPATAPATAPDIVVLYRAEAPRFRTRCPESRCRYVPIDALAGRRVGIRASTVIVAGHGTHTEWLGLDAEALAAVIAGFAAELIVVDTCFGANAELLAALPPGALVVAASTLLPPQGLDYRPPFFEPGDPSERAAAVVDPPGAPLLRWFVAPSELEAARARVEVMAPEALAEALASRVPARLRVSLGDAGPALMAFDWTRLPARSSRRGLGGPARIDTPE